MSQNIVVVGGSSGIGAACIALYVQEGYRVFNLDKQPLQDLALLNLLKDKSSSDHHHQVSTVPCDITSEEEVQHAVAKIYSAGAAVSELIISSGVHFQGDIDQTSMSKIRDVFEVNILGVMRVLKAFVPPMKLARAGSIVLVGSDQCFLSKPGMAAYSPSKGALSSLTRSMALELGGYNLRINCVCPGATQTPMLENAIDEIRESCALSEVEILATIAKENPLGRIGEAHEVAEVIRFVASPKASFVHGAIIPVDGGLTTGCGTSFS